MMKPMKQATVRERRKFDETFKREAVQNWLRSGKSAEVVAEELGLTANLLYAWRKLVPAVAGGRATAAKPGSVADLQGQLDASQRENRHLREQCTILKKHWASSPNRRTTLPTDRRDERRSSGPLALPAPGDLAQRLLCLAKAACLSRAAHCGGPGADPGDRPDSRPKPANLWESARPERVAQKGTLPWTQPHRPACEAKGSVRPPEGPLSSPDHR